MGDDMLSSFNSALSSAASVINGAASVLGSTFDIDETKELHEWSHEKSQEWMREDPAISLQGLKNAGLSPVSATGNYFTAGASGAGYPHAPVADKAQRMALFNESIMAADQLKTNKVQRELLIAQASKENAEASLFNSQARGQEFQNLDYDNVMKNFGGFLNSQAYNNFIHAEITSDSRFVNQLRNRLDSAIIQGQLGDPDVMSAFVRLPVNQQNLIISEISKNFQDALLSMAKQKTEGTVQSLNRALKDKTEMETDQIAQSIWQNELEFANWLKTVKESLPNTISNIFHPDGWLDFGLALLKYIANAPFNVFGQGGMFPRRGNK